MAVDLQSAQPRVAQPKLSFLSSGTTSTVWRLDGAFEGYVIRLLRPDAELPFGGVDHLAREVGDEYIRSPLAAVEVDAALLRQIWEAEGNVNSAVLEGVSRSITEVWYGGKGVTPGRAMGTIELDSTRLPLWPLLQADPPGGAQNVVAARAVSPPSEPCLCIEIKPKSGILPIGGPLAKMAPGYCRYCLQEQAKRRKGAPRSEYCPLDLYSMERHRVERAVKSLLTAPRNNLRVFRREGEVVFGRGAAHEAQGALAHEMRREFGHGTRDRDTTDEQWGTDDGWEVALLVDLIANVLLQEPLLPRLEATQKRSTLYAYEALQKYERACELIGKSNVDLSLKRLLGDGGDEKGIHSDSQTKADIERLRAWLLGLSAADVSIMVCLRKIPNQPNGHTQNRGQRPAGSSPGVVTSSQGFGSVAYRLFVVDAYLKPPSKFAEHARRDEEISLLPFPQDKPPCTSKVELRRSH